LLYGLLIIQCGYWLCFYDVLFGANSMVLTKPYPMQRFSDLAFFLYSQLSPHAAYWFILPVLLLSLISLIKPVYFIGDALIWLLTVNLHNRLYASLSGGDYLLNQLLFFNCFLSARYAITNSSRNAAKVFLHNLGVVLIIAQINFTYILSALAKLGDPLWLSGRAVLSISQVQHYALFSMPKFPDLLYIILNYVVLLYQCLFPIMIWLKPVKKPFIIIGIGMHLYIALVMGLVSFGLIMISGYIFFWPFSTSQKDD